jgi:hypothetical protein
VVGGEGVGALKLRAAERSFRASGFQPLLFSPAIFLQPTNIC